MDGIDWTKLKEEELPWVAHCPVPLYRVHVNVEARYELGGTHSVENVFTYQILPNNMLLYGTIADT